MAEIEIGENAPTVQSPEDIGILINEIKYKYSITQSEKEKDLLIIKLYDPTNNSNYYFSYEATYEKIRKDIKFVSMYENLDEIIDSLKEIFYKGNVEIQEKDGEYNLELKIIGVKKKCFIQLIKHEIEKPKEPKSEFEVEINKLKKNLKIC